MIPAPMIHYRYAILENGETDYFANTDWNTTSRSWLLVRYRRSPEEHYRVVVGMHVYEQFPDFCGGFIYHSPRIERYERMGTWGSPAFYEPTRLPVPYTDWEFLDSDDWPGPDLNRILGDNYVSDDRARDWMQEQMAYDLLSYAVGNNKRIIVACDKTTGSISEILKVLDRLPQAVKVLYGTSMITTDIGGSNHRAVCNYLPKRLCEVSIGELVRTSPVENYNSGRSVFSASISLDFVGNDEEIQCEECGYYNFRDVDKYCLSCDAPLPEPDRPELIVNESEIAEYARAFSDPRYTILVKRGLWRNG